MTRSSKEWLWPLTGVLFVVVLIVSFAVGGEPESADEGAGKVVEWYVDNKDAAEIGALLSVVAGLFLITFGAYLRRQIGAATSPEGSGDIFSIVAFIGVVIVSVGAAIDATIVFAAAEAADDEVDRTAILALQALWDNDFLPFMLGILCFLWGTGLAVVTTGVLPKWLGWVMILLGVLAFTPAGFVSFLGSGLLVLIISVILTLRARKGAAPPPPAPAAS